MKHVFLGAALILATATTAAAEDEKNWNGEVSLTGSKTTGNTDTTDIGLALKLEKLDNKWKHKFNASGDFGKNNGRKNRQRFDLGYQIDRQLNDRLYIYGNADYFNDEFGAFEEGYFVGTGLGYKAILPEPVKWDLEAGLGYRSQKTGDTAFMLSRTENELALRAFSDFDWVLNENVSAYNDSEIIYSESDTYLWNETGITANLAGNLAARASFRIDHHTDVPFLTEKTDTITRFGIVYTMK